MKNIETVVKLAGFDYSLLNESGTVGMLNTPFIFADGDSIPVFIEELDGEAVRFFDDGEAYMRLRNEGLFPDIDLETLQVDPQASKQAHHFMKSMAEKLGGNFTARGELEFVAETEEDAPEAFAMYIEAMQAIAQCCLDLDDYVADLDADYDEDCEYTEEQCDKAFCPQKGRGVEFVLEFPMSRASDVFKAQQQMFMSFMEPWLEFFNTKPQCPKTDGAAEPQECARATACVKEQASKSCPDQERQAIQACLDELAANLTKVQELLRQKIEAVNQKEKTATVQPQETAVAQEAPESTVSAAGADVLADTQAEGSQEITQTSMHEQESPAAQAKTTRPSRAKPKAA